MEVIVCLLTTLFFAALGIRDIKVHSSGMAHQKCSDKEFVVVPFYVENRVVKEITAGKVE